MCEAKKQRTKSTTYMMMTATIPSLESSCLAICSPLHVVSVHCRLFFVHAVTKKLVLSPVASAMTAVHRDRLVLASYTPWPSTQPLMPRGQIVSSDVPLLTDRRTPHNYNLNNDILLCIVLNPVGVYYARKFLRPCPQNDHERAQRLAVGPVFKALSL